MKKYECLFILNSSTPEAEKTATVEKFKNFLAAEKAKNIEVNVWGVKKYAYPINYKNDGYYVLMNFESAPEVPNKLSALMRITEDVVRSMFVAKE